MAKETNERESETPRTTTTLPRVDVSCAAVVIVIMNLAHGAIDAKGDFPCTAERTATSKPGTRYLSNRATVWPGEGRFRLSRLSFLLFCSSYHCVGAFFSDFMLTQRLPFVALVRAVRVANRSTVERVSNASAFNEP